MALKSWGLFREEEEEKECINLEENVFEIN